MAFLNRLQRELLKIQTITQFGVFIHITKIIWRSKKTLV
jgi:hypothetical protein